MSLYKLTFCEAGDVGTLASQETPVFQELSTPLYQGRWNKYCPNAVRNGIPWARGQISFHQGCRHARHKPVDDRALP
jgi:hypothetical protein